MSDDDTDTAVLDAWLAEHLLGWTWWVHKQNVQSEHAGQRFIGPNDGSLKWFCWPAQGGESIHDAGNAPKLSTTGDGMLMVLEAMQGRGWQALSHLFPDDSLRHATFIPEDVSATTEDWVSADTLPLAVAQAARAALEAR